MPRPRIRDYFGGLIAILIATGCEHSPTASPESVTTDRIRSIASATLPSRVPDFQTEILPILERSCLDCHDARSQRGGVVLEGILEGGAQAIDRATWSRVADALRSGSMPPGGRVQLAATDRKRIEVWIDAEVFACASADQYPGRVTLRRLNRAEYDQTIRDLFGFDHDLHLSATFPADDVGEGFDRIGDVLAIPPILMEKYLIAADRVLDAAFQSTEIRRKLLNPQPDAIPQGLRQPMFAVRSEPNKRIGRPAPVVPVVEDPQVIKLRLAHEILRAVADRAFRRPATQEELARLVSLVESALKEGDDFDQAIRFALKAILISPHFLFLVEEGSATDDADRSRPLNDFALATRLSYFLTSGPPDDELFQRAVQGDLRRADNLRMQVERLLRGEKSQALCDGFCAQWLQIRALQDVTPDPDQFPDFDEPLRLAMFQETCRFTRAIIQEDRDVIEFLDADFTFLNERLARHYGIPGVIGPRFRRVALQGSHRGGILTQASILTVTSNPTRTSPVKRGKWILEALLGLAPLPPPAGVEGLEAVAGASPSGSIRQQMIQHRRDPACASCHDQMDPLGFGLENFDAIGAWRTSAGGSTIDASGILPGGVAFSGPTELRALLKAKSDDFIRCLSEKLLTYALGRGLRPTDRCLVDEIVRKTRRDGDRFSALVQAIVACPAFQNRSGMRPEK